MRRIAGVSLALVVATAACASDDERAAQVIRVEEGQSITEAVERARTGDIVLIAPGIYHESVKVEVDGITIRGEDRNAVVLDGEHRLPNGIAVAADDVAVENLTVHSFTQNGVLFNGIEAASDGKGVDAGVVYGTGDDVLRGFRTSYVTAYNNGLYGIYAFASRDGVIEHSYVSGHPDSGIYIGQCKPCNTVVRNVTAERNAIGYYGTNASGDVFVVESTFRDNRLGIAPNSQRAERLTPQEATVVAGNLVVDNDDPLTPPIPDGFFGVGIAVGGGTENLVVRNRVEGNDVAGIVVIPLNDFEPLGNTIEGNVLADNGVDLVYAGSPDGGRNCFADNEFTSSSPDSIEAVLTCGGDGAGASGAWSTPDDPDGVDYREMAAPPTQPSMPATDMRPLGGAGPVPVIDVASIPLPDR